MSTTSTNTTTSATATAKPIQVVLFPPTPVVNVPICVAYYLQSNNNRIESFNEKNIVSLTWTIDDHVVQHYDSSLSKPSSSLFKRIFFSSSSSSSSNDQSINLFKPTIQQANKELKVDVVIKCKELGILTATPFTFTQKIHTHPKRDEFVLDYDHINHYQMSLKEKVVVQQQQQEKEEEEKEEEKETQEETKDENGSTIPKPPPLPPVETVKSSLSSYPSSNRVIPDDALRIIQFNIQADIYTHPQRYHYCPSYALYRPYRQYIIPEYILEHNGDIVCLQEVEVEFDRLRKVLIESGYNHTAVLAKETDRQHEQCITFYQTSRIQVIEEHLVNYNTIEKHPELISKEQIASLTNNNVHNTNMYNQLLHTLHHNRHNILLLECKKTNQKFIVVNVHLYWGASSNDTNYYLQILQMNMLLIMVQNILTRHKLGSWTTIDDNFETNTPIIISGDFNNGPANYTYRYLAKGNLNVNTNQGLVNYQHPFKFKSAYNLHPNGELKYTCITRDFKGCVDQIFVNDKIKVESLLEVEKYYGECLPTITEASDHILIASTITFLKNKE
ncbi:endonuclease/exonuclease/phosphatase domain-containing protein [Cavenderia fasciculata]|uniref:Endonuclease/exonuclease/phosphatase domain-containing protein n=1 Tax=Cavenderia fasciculata TaxID=261658 RepID=F4Q8M1_CACFS|nr:endonuclease/exonuclease/phosphatase domain-containing protein [Cavenderia fasciculata]EGG16121.1 endonuclease/exonuclease/phosphatase domain-containing protein [Cavenderia fasciculata]|eukprot:XP_004352455.1 endonuclease/exonuclease/phosphatase domain-containing protein [Cavenderia fasciculata]